MSNQSLDVLQMMGLSEGYHIPIANAENVKLEEELQQLILAKSKATGNLDSLKERCAGLDKHLNYVHTEQLENQVIKNSMLVCFKI